MGREVEQLRGAKILNPAILSQNCHQVLGPVAEKGKVCLNYDNGPLVTGWRWIFGCHNVIKLVAGRNRDFQVFQYFFSQRLPLNGRWYCYSRFHYLICRTSSWKELVMLQVVHDLPINDALHHHLGLRPVSPLQIGVINRYSCKGQDTYNSDNHHEFHEGKTGLLFHLHPLAWWKLMLNPLGGYNNDHFPWIGIGEGQAVAKIRIALIGEAYELRDLVLCQGQVFGHKIA